MKLLFSLLLCLATLGTMAQTPQKYLAGAVPVENGMVQFAKTYKVPGKSQTEIFAALQEYVLSTVVGGQNSLNQSRITESDTASGTIAASMEEFLYFKRTALVSHGTRFFYQLICQVGEGEYRIEMRRIHYLYDGSDATTAQAQSIRAEEWITDAEALKKDGKRLNRMAGKFRIATIDRKNEIFTGAAVATGAEVKKKVVIVEED